MIKLVIGGILIAFLVDSQAIPWVGFQLVVEGATFRANSSHEGIFIAQAGVVTCTGAIGVSLVINFTNIAEVQKGIHRLTVRNSPSQTLHPSVRWLVIQGAFLAGPRVDVQDQAIRNRKRNAGIVGQFVSVGAGQAFCGGGFIHLDAASGIIDAFCAVEKLEGVTISSSDKIGVVPAINLVQGPAVNLFGVGQAPNHDVVAQGASPAILDADRFLVVDLAIGDGPHTTSEPIGGGVVAIFADQTFASVFVEIRARTRDGHFLT